MLVGVVGFLAVAVVLVVAVAVLGTPAGQSRSASQAGIGAAGSGPSESERVGADLAAAQWTRYTATDGAFSIDLPGPPVVEAELPPGSPFITSEFVSVDLRSTAYVAGANQLRPDYVWVDPSAALTDTADILGEGMGITFSSRTKSTFGYLPALTLTGSVEGGKGTVQAVAFVSERRIFLLATVAYDGVLVDHDRFVDSFAAG